MSENIYGIHQTLTIIILSLILLRALAASLIQWRGKPVWGHKFVSVLANTVLDIQIVIGIILWFFGTTPSLNHLLIVTLAAGLAHFSYSVEKRRGSSLATVASAWGAVIAVSILFI